jgi:crotonobetainyl-CoA:carnitine CoA-transferase CaiB-like acyl-CoA transferase
VPENVFLGELGRAARILSDIVHPVFDEYPRLAPMVRFSRSQTIAKSGCVCGAHTDAVLTEIGYSDERIAELRAKGVIGG